MKKKIKKSLIIYIDMKNMALNYEIYSANFYLDIIKNKFFSIIKIEKKEFDDLTLVINNSSNLFRPFYLFREICFQSFNMEMLELIFDFFVKMVIQNLNENFVGKKPKIFSLNKLIDNLVNELQYDLKPKKFIVLINYEKFKKMDMEKDLDISFHNSNFIKVYVDFIIDVVNTPFFKFSKLWYKDTLHSILKNFNLNIYSYNELEEDLQSHNNELFTSLSQELNIFEMGREIGKFEIDYFDEELMIYAKKILNWNLIEDYPTKLILSKNGLEKKFYCVIAKSDSKYNFIYSVEYSNNKIQEIEKDINYEMLLEKERLFIEFAKNLFVKNDKEILRSAYFKDIPFKYMESLLRSEYIYFIIDDQENIKEEFSGISNFINFIDENSYNDHMKIKYIIKEDDNIFFLKLKKRTRNIHMIRVVLVKYRNKFVQNIVGKKIIKEFLNKIKTKLREEQILIYPKKLTGVIRCEKIYTTGQLKLEYKNLYILANFPYNFGKDPKNETNNILYDNTLIKKNCPHLFFYYEEFQSAILNLLTKLDFKMFLNFEIPKSTMIFFKIYKIKSTEKKFSKMAILFFNIEYSDNKISKIHCYFNTENLFLETNPEILSEIKKDIGVINLFLDKVDLFITMYYLILGNISNDIFKSELDVIKKSLYYIKYEIPLTYFFFNSFSKDHGKITDDKKLNVIEFFRYFCWEKQYSNSNNIENNKKNLNEDLIKGLLNFSSDTSQIKLFNLYDDKLNKNLIENYTNILSEYTDYIYKFRSSKIFYFKLLIKEVFLIFDINSDRQEIFIDTYLICLKCIKDNLNKIVDRIDIKDVNQSDFKDLLLDFNCKYQQKNSTLFTGKTLSNLKKLLDSEFIMLLRKIVDQKENSFINIQNYLDTFVKSVEKTSILCFPYFMQKCLEKDKIMKMKFYEDLEKIFNFIFNSFFQKIDNNENNSNFYILNFSEKNLDLSCFEPRIRNSPVIELLASNFATFQSYLHQISSNLNLLLLQIYVNISKNKKPIHNFSQLMQILIEEKNFNKIVLAFRNYSPKFSHYKGLINNELFHELKIIENKEKYFKNKLFSSIFDTSCYIYGFDNIRKKIWNNHIKKVFESFFSCFYLEFYLHFKEANMTQNIHQSLCKNLENCNKKYVINFDLVNSDNLNLNKIYFEMKKNSNYEVINLSSKTKIEALSIISKNNTSDIFSNYILKTNSVEIRIYHSLKYEDDFEICEKCNSFWNILKKYKIIGYFSFLRKLIKSVHSNSKKKQSENEKDRKKNEVKNQENNCSDLLSSPRERNSHRANIHKKTSLCSLSPKQKKFQTTFGLLDEKRIHKTKTSVFTKSYSDFRYLNCMYLCETIINIFEIIYQNNAKILLKHINDGIIKEENIMTYLQSEKTGEVTKKKAFLKIIYKKPIRYVNINKKEIFESILADGKLSIACKSKKDGLYIFKLKELDYIVLVRLVKKDRYKDDDEFPVILVLFYGVYQNNCKEHFSKIVSFIEERVNSHITASVKEMLPYISSLISQDLKIIKYMNLYYKSKKFFIKFPKVDKNMLILFFNSELGKYLSPVEGEYQNHQNSIKVNNYSNIPLEFRDSKFYTLKSNYHDFSFLSNMEKKLVDNSESIFYLVHSHENFEILCNKNLITDDNNLVFGLFNRDPINQDTLKVSDILYKNEDKDTSYYLDINYLKNNIKNIYITSEEDEVNDYYSLMIDIKKIEDGLNINDLQNKILELFTDSFFYYYIELILSLFSITENDLNINKNLFSFQKVLSNLIKLDRLPSDCYYKKIKNTFFKTYLFHNFETLCKLFKEIFVNKGDFLFIYIYFNKKSKIKIVDYDLLKFEKKMNFYFEGRNILFDNEELNFSFMIFPKGIHFDTLDENFYLLKRKNKHKYSEEISEIFDSDKKIRKKNYTQSFYIKTESNLIKKSPVFESFRSCIKNKNTNFNETDVRKNIPKKKRNLVDKEVEIDFNLFNLPPKRFFLLLKMDFDEVELLTYNIQEELNETCLKIVQKYLSTIELKKEIQIYVAMQKLGFHYKLDQIEEREDLKVGFANKEEIYLNSAKSDNGSESCNFTNFIINIFSDSLDYPDIVLNEMTNKKEEILSQFYKIQFCLINAYSGKHLKLISFKTQRKSSNSFSHLLKNYYIIVEHYYRKRLNENKLRIWIYDIMHSVLYDEKTHYFNNCKKLCEAMYPFYYLTANFIFNDCPYFQDDLYKILIKTFKNITPGKKFKLMKFYKKTIDIDKKKRFLKIDQIKNEQIKNFYLKNFSEKFLEIIPYTDKSYFIYKYLYKSKIYFMIFSHKNLLIKAKLKVFIPGNNLFPFIDKNIQNIDFGLFFNIRTFFESYKFDNVSSIILTNWIKWMKNNNISIPFFYKFQRIMREIPNEDILINLYRHVNSQNGNQLDQAESDNKLEGGLENIIAYEKKIRKKALKFYENNLLEIFYDLIFKNFPSFFYFNSLIIEKEKKKNKIFCFLINKNELNDIVLPEDDDLIISNLNQKFFSNYNENSSFNFVFLKVVLIHKKKKKLCQEFFIQNRIKFNEKIIQIVSYNYYATLELELVLKYDLSFLEFILPKFSKLSKTRKEDSIFKTLKIAKIFSLKFIDFIKEKFKNCKIYQHQKSIYLIYSISNIYIIFEFRNRTLFEIHYNFYEHLKTNINQTSEILTNKTITIDEEIKNILFIIYMWVFQYLL